MKCKKDTESINPKVSETINKKIILLSKCAVCNNKKSRFIKKQKARGLLSKLGIRIPLGKIPLLGNILFSKSIFYKLFLYKKVFIITNYQR